MATWYMTQLITFRGKRENESYKQVTVNLENPLKSLEELETKLGIQCPEDRKRELLEKVQPHAVHALPSWLRDVSVPEWYKSASAIDIDNALQWGSEMVQEQKKLNESKLHETIDLKWKQIVREKELELEEKEKQTHQLLEDYKMDLMRQVNQKESEVQLWQKKAFENLSLSGIEEKIRSSREEWEESQKKLLDAIERERRTLVEHIEQLRSQNKMLEQSRESLQTKLEKRDAVLNKSVHKGNVGEEMVDEWLRTAFHGCVVENTSKETGKMDRLLNWDGVQVMIDVKNHDGELHSVKDVKKFHDNLVSSDVSIGILLCTKTRVPKRNRYWVETEFVNDHQLAVYMNDVSKNPIERLQLLVGTIFQPWKDYVQLRQKVSEMVKGDELKSWSDKARCVLLSGWSMMMNLYGGWESTQKSIESSLKGFDGMFMDMTRKLQSELRELSLDVEIQLKKKRK